MVINLPRLALRCSKCNTLFEIPDPGNQSEDIREQYEKILPKMKFSCPHCGTKCLVAAEEEQLRAATQLRARVTEIG